MAEFSRWFRDNGDETRLLNHELSSESVVFEVGGYLGKFTDELFKRFNCKIYVFEPVKKFYEKLNERFKKNNNIHTFNCGLYKKNTEVYMNVDENNGENSTIYERSIIDNSQNEKIVLRKLDDVMEENNLQSIDLLNINIEGGEYDLLSYLTKTPIIYNIKNIQIQFHDFIENAEVKRNIIHAKLNNTHKMTYNYDFVWENWKLR